MRRLTVFNQVSIDGYFATPSGDMAWLHGDHGKDDPELAEFVARNASGGGDLLLGHRTYELMAAFWPTAMAHQQLPAVAKGMTAARKWVCAHGAPALAWQNSQLLEGELIASVRALKASSGPTLAILGSGTIVAQLTAAQLVDEYQVMILPVALGAGRTMFAGVERPIDLHLTSSRTFKNGNTYLVYEVRA